MTLRRQLALLGAMVLVFALFNGCMYLLLTGRLSNNFSDATQAQMVDVGRYLPHEPGSDLARVPATLKLTGGASVYPAGGFTSFKVYVPTFNGCDKRISPLSFVVKVSVTFEISRLSGIKIAFPSLSNT